MTSPIRTDDARPPKRNGVLISLHTFLALLLAAMLLILLAMWWLGLGLENGKVLTASLVTVLIFGTAGEFLRRRCRISLKLLLAAFTAIAVLLGILAQPLLEARKRSIIVSRLQRLDASVSYEYQDEGKDWFAVKGGLTLPIWVRNILGEDVFADVCHIGLTGSRCRDADLVGINQLTHLQDLQLNDSRISSGGLKHLAGLQNLEWVMMDGKQATQEGLRSLGALPKLADLTLEGRFVTDDTLAYLKHLPEIHSLNLRDTSVTDKGLRHLVVLKSLQRLDLSSRQIGDAAIAHLKPLPRLKELGLHRSGVTDTGFMQLVDLRTLRCVLLYGSSLVTEEAARNLQEAMPNIEIRQ